MSGEWIGILGVVITSVGTLIGVIITNKSANNKLIQQATTNQAVFEAHVQEKIDALTKEVKRHNSIIERTYKLETQQQVQEEKIASLERRISMKGGTD